MTVVLKKTSEEQENNAVVPPPDGGWGWMVVAGSFMIHVIADGMAYSYGVYLDTLVEEFNASHSSVGFLGSFMLGVTWGCGPVASILVNKFGCRTVAILGTIIAAVGFIISTFAPNIILMYFSFGLIGGFGLGLAYLPAIVAVSFYFERRRSFATGLAVCGSGVGTFIFAPLTNLLVEEYGWRGSILIETGILLNCILCGAVFRPLVAPRRPPKPSWEEEGVVLTVDGQPQSPATKANGLLLPPDGPATLGASCSSLAFARSPQLMSGALTASQAVLNKLPSSSDDAGSHLKVWTSRRDISPAGSSRSINKLNGGSSGVNLSPLDRKDIFYTASLNNIPLYKSDPDDYRRSVVSIPKDCADHPTAFDSTEAKEKSLCLKLMDWRLMLDICFLLFVISNLLTSIGLCVPYVFIVDRAVEEGHAKGKAALLLSIIGVTNTVGRIVFGFLADFKFVNRLMLYNTVLVICGATSMLSALCVSYALLAIYAGVFGLLMGVYICLTPIVIVDLLGLEKLSDAFGLVLLFQGIGAVLGGLLPGFVYDATHDYNNSFYMMGVCIFVSGAMLFAIPFIKRCQQTKPTETEIALGMKAMGSGQIYTQVEGNEKLHVAAAS